MEFRHLGHSGLKVSAIGLGCNNFGGRIDLEASRRVVHAALDHGITLFDTADIYGNMGGSEDCLGKILGARRKDIVLATKFAKPMDDAETLRGGSRHYIVQALEASLRRLNTDWIDLYQMHETDRATPIEETLRALDDLIRAGKVRYIGCSNFPAWEMIEAEWTGRHLGLNRFVSCQDEYSLLERGIERELVPAMEAYGLGLLPYFPLAGGLLTGKYRRGTKPQAGTRFADTPRYADRYMTDANWVAVEKLETFAKGHGKTLLELAFAWLLAKRPVASVIAGATKPEQVGANVKAGAWALTAAEVTEVDAIAAAPDRA